MVQTKLRVLFDSLKSRYYTEGQKVVLKTPCEFLCSDPQLWSIRFRLEWPKGKQNQVIFIKFYVATRQSSNRSLSEIMAFHWFWNSSIRDSNRTTWTVFHCPASHSHSAILGGRPLSATGERTYSRQPYVNLYRFGRLSSLMLAAAWRRSLALSKYAVTVVDMAWTASAFPMDGVTFVGFSFSTRGGVLSS